MIMTASLIVSASLSSRLCVSDETECQQVTSYRANIINNDIYSASAADRSIMNQDVLYDKKEDLEEETRKAEEYRAEAERLMTELQDKSKEIAEVTDKLEKTNERIDSDSHPDPFRKLPVLVYILHELCADTQRQCER